MYKDKKQHMETGRFKLDSNMLLEINLKKYI